MKTAYKVFVERNGKLYPPMVANPGGEPTPVGEWVKAAASPVIAETKTGRPQVQCGGKGTSKAKSGTLAYRPGFHCAELPTADQFRRKDGSWPENFVWAEVEYEDGAATFSINADGFLIWDDQKENCGEGRLFEKADME